MKRFKAGLLLAAVLTALLAGCNYLIDSSAPSVAITNPGTGTISPQSTTVSVAASDDDSGIASIKLLVNGNEVKTEIFQKDEEGRYSLDAAVLTYDWAVSTTGEYTLKAVAKNGYGRTSEAERTVSVTKPSDPDSPDEEKPTVEWISPTADDSYSGVLDLAVAANDDKGVTRVEFYAGSTLLATDSDAPYSYEWDTEDADVGRDDGPVTLTARAYDAVGKFGEDGISVTLLNSGIPPTMTIVSPNDGQEIGATFDVVAEVVSGGENYRWQLNDGRISSGFISTTTVANLVDSRLLNDG